MERINCLLADVELYVRPYVSEQGRWDAIQVWVHPFRPESPVYRPTRTAPGLTRTGPSQERHALLPSAQGALFQMDEWGSCFSSFAVLAGRMS